MLLLLLLTTLLQQGSAIVLAGEDVDPSALRITNLTLVDTRGMNPNIPLPLENYGEYTYDLGDVSPRLTILAHASDVTASVVFDLDDMLRFKRESNPPYTLGRSQGLQFSPVAQLVQPGRHVIRVSAWSEERGKGVQGPVVTLTLWVTQGGSLPPTLAPSLRGSHAPHVLSNRAPDPCSHLATHTVSHHCPDTLSHIGSNTPAHTGSHGNAYPCPHITGHYETNGFVQKRLCRMHRECRLLFWHVRRIDESMPTRLASPHAATLVIIIIIIIMATRVTRKKQETNSTIFQFPS